MSYVVTDPQHASIDGIPLATPAWLLINLEVLASGPAVRGNNRTVPYAITSRPMRKRPTETRQTLELVIFGDYDATGTAHTDPEQGVWDNWFTLRSHFDTLLLTAGESTAELTLTLKGRTLSGTVQVVAYNVGNALNREHLNATLEVVLLGGMLVEDVGP